MNDPPDVIKPIGRKKNISKLLVINRNGIKYFLLKDNFKANKL
jgi:hypothetical protein